MLVTPTRVSSLGSRGLVGCFYDLEILSCSVLAMRSILGPLYVGNSHEGPYFGAQETCYLLSDCTCLLDMGSPCRVILIATGW